MAPGSKSVLARANPKTISLRTTVPLAIVEQLDLKEGNVLDWEIQFLEGKKVVVVKKVEEYVTHVWR